MIFSLWLKEIKSQVFTWKGTLWLVIASILFSFSSYLMLTDKELSLLDQTELLWLFGKIIMGVGLLIVTIDSSSILTTEFERETAESLFLAPISLKSVIISKGLASLTLWFAIFFVAAPYMIVTASGTSLVAAFLGYILLLGTLGVTGMILLITGISLLYRSSKHTLTTSLVILLAFTIPALFSSTLKNNGAALYYGKINPINNMFESLDNVLVDYQLSFAQNWKFLLPLLLFLAASLIILLISIRFFTKWGVIKND